MKLASNAKHPSIAATPASVDTSHARTPNSRLFISAAAPIEHASPSTIPIPASNPASFRIIPCTALRCAPSAIRTPISRVRWLTEYATTPYRPTTPSTSASPANPPTSHADS